MKINPRLTRIRDSCKNTRGSYRYTRLAKGSWPWRDILNGAQTRAAAKAMIVADNKALRAHFDQPILSQVGVTLGVSAGMFC